MNPKPRQKIRPAAGAKRGAAVQPIDYEDPPSRRPPTPFILTRAAAVLAGLGIFFGIVCAYAGDWWPIVLWGFITDGLIAAGWVTAAALAGDLVLRRLGFGGDERDQPLRLVTATGIGLGLLSLILLGLGLAGWLHRGTIVLLPALALTAWAVDRWWPSRSVTEPGGVVTGRAEGTSSELRSDRADTARLRKGGVESARLLSRPGLMAWLLAPAGWSAIWLAAIPFLAIAATAASIMPGALWKPHDPHPYDVMSYHLEIPREWYETGRISPLLHNAFSYFPMNQEMHYLAAMELRGGPWAGMYVIQFFNLMVMLLMVLTVRGLIIANSGAITPEERSRARAAGAAGGVLAAATPWVVMLGSVPYVESGFMFYGILSGAWALRAMQAQHGRVRHLALAGLLAGLAGGVKYTAVPMILVAVPTALAAAAFFGRRVTAQKESPAALHRERSGAARAETGAAHVETGSALLDQSVIRPAATPPRSPFSKFALGCAVFLFAGTVTLSPWLIRNLAWTRNPIFPLGMKVLGHAHFTPTQIERFRIAHSPVPIHAGVRGRLQAIWHGILADWQFAFLLVPLGFLAAALCWRRFAGRFLLGMLVIQLIVWVGFTHLQPRFFVPAIPFAAAAAGLAFCGRRIWIGITAAGIAMILGLCTLLPVFAHDLNAQPSIRSLFAIDDPSLVQPEELNKLEADFKLAVIGDGQAFFQNVPTSRLLYRSVFDVNIPPGADPVDAWLGRSVEELRHDGYIVIINTSELNRVSKTYYGIPPVPQKWRRPNDIPSILPPETGGKK